jgi:hypothetical protein
MKKSPILLSLLAVTVIFTGIHCDYLSQIINQAAIQPPTTKEKMMGVWEVTAATDETGTSILNDINFPVTAFSMEDANSVISTAGPMFMKIVYGKSKYTQIASQVDQVFHYADLSFTTGEWFIDPASYDDRFTIEMKLQGLPGQKSLTTLLAALGIHSQFLDATVYHKFLDVQVTFGGTSDSTMTWTFDSQTTAIYNSKDSQGNLVLWQGWPTTSFGHFTFVLTKRATTVTDLIKAH